MKKYILIAITISITILLLAGCGGKTTNIDLSSFAEIKATGYDGQAVAFVSVNWHDLETAILGGDDADYAATMMLMQVLQSIEYEVDKSGELSNGDTVTMIVTWDNDIAKRHNLSFSASKKTMVVSDLEVHPSELGPAGILALGEIDGYITSYRVFDNETLMELDRAAHETIHAHTNLERRDIFYPLTEPFPRINTVDILEILLAKAYFFTHTYIANWDSRPDPQQSLRSVLFLVYEVRFISEITEQGEIDVVYLPMFKNMLKPVNTSVSSHFYIASNSNVGKFGNSHSLDIVHSNLMDFAGDMYIIEEIDLALFAE